MKIVISKSAFANPVIPEIPKIEIITKEFKSVVQKESKVKLSLKHIVSNLKWKQRMYSDTTSKFSTDLGLLMQPEVSTVLPVISCINFVLVLIALATSVNFYCKMLVFAFLVNEICFRFSPPQCLLSDLGSNFISEVVKETCNLFGIDRIYTSPYHPQTDGLLEKFHSTLGKNLSMYVARDHKDWDLYVRGICYGYNTSICTESTQYSPFYLMFGREPYSPLDTILPSQRNVPNTVSEYALQLAHAREVAKQNIADTQERIKMRYDETSNYKPLEPGELVSQK